LLGFRQEMARIGNVNSTNKGKRTGKEHQLFPNRKNEKGGIHRQTEKKLARPETGSHFRKRKKVTQFQTSKKKKMEVGWRSSKSVQPRNRGCKLERRRGTKTATMPGSKEKTL